MIRYILGFWAIVIIVRVLGKYMIIWYSDPEVSPELCAPTRLALRVSAC